MVTTGMSRTVSRTVAALAHDLEEDIATRWVPDVLGNLDLIECLESPSMTANDVQFVEVPKQNLQWRTAPILNAQALRALRDAVSPLRSVSDSLLDPSVCGYRTGSTSGIAYSDEYMRFRDIGSALAETNRYVAIADVRGFFDSVDAETVRQPMSAQLKDLWQPIHTFLVEADQAGIRGLPAGYGDARLIANHLLRKSDAAIGSPFTRWVDDYRIYASTFASAQQAIQRLADSLEEFGFSINIEKLDIIRTDEYLDRRHGLPLESVYHPDTESYNTVRANLRAVFLRAVNSNNRRLLRFSLPRLAEQNDPIAVEYAINQIGTDSVDTPRLVHYLSAFLSERMVDDGIQNLVQNSTLSPWTTTRVGPLLCNIRLRRKTIEALSNTIQVTNQPALWASLLRVLAIHGQKDLVEHELAEREPLDARAAIGACVDLGSAIPAELRWLAPPTARAAEQTTRMPRPAAYTLL